MSQDPKPNRLSFGLVFETPLSEGGWLRLGYTEQGNPIVAFVGYEPLVWNSPDSISIERVTRMLHPDGEGVALEVRPGLAVVRNNDLVHWRSGGHRVGHCPVAFVGRAFGIEAGGSLPMTEEQVRELRSLFAHHKPEGISLEITDGKAFLGYLRYGELVVERTTDFERVRWFLLGVRAATEQGVPRGHVPYSKVYRG